MKSRYYTAQLIKKVLMGELSVANALKMFPKDLKDMSLQVAFHALVHYEADEDIRAKSSFYRRVQDDYLYDIAECLERGEDIPQNIVSEYTKYHDKNAPIYPEINKKTIFERLKKFINIEP